MKWKFVNSKLFAVAFASAVLLSISIPSFAQKKMDTRLAEMLIPEGCVVQYAGNIGMISAGAVWCYGKNDHWETEFLVGYVPKRNSVDGAATFSLKETLAPWDIAIPALSGERGRLSVAPAYFNLSYNLITGESFWHTHKKKDKENFDYYQFSSKARLGFGLGSRLSFESQALKRMKVGKVSLYYEFSTYELAVRSSICNKSVNVFDILALGLGVQIRFL